MGQISNSENGNTYLRLLSTKAILVQFRFCKKTKTIKTPLNCHVDTIKQSAFTTMPWRVVKIPLHDSTATPGLTTGSGHFSLCLETSKKFCSQQVLFLEPGHSNAKSKCHRNNSLLHWTPDSLVSFSHFWKRQDTCGNYLCCRRGENFSCSVILCKCICTWERNCCVWNQSEETRFEAKPEQDSHQARSYWGLIGMSARWKEVHQWIWLHCTCTGEQIPAQL